MPGTFEGLQVLLDSVDSAPPARECKGDCVAAHATESIKDDFLRRGSFLGNVLCYLADAMLMKRSQNPRDFVVLSNALLCNAKPGVIGHQNAIVVF